MRQTVLMRAAVVAILGLVLGGRVLAQDLLQETKARQAVKAQELERQINDLHTEAARAGKTRPAEAVELLKSALATLDADQLLATEKRERLLRVTKALLREYQADVRDRKLGISADGGRLDRTDQRMTEQDRQRTDAAYLARQQAQARNAQNAGNSFEAQRIYNDMARRFPDNPAVQSDRTMSGIGGAVAASQDLKRRRAEGMLLVYQGIDKTALLPAGDVEFPADWVEKSKRRTRNTMTEKERAILKALEKPIEAEFGGATLQEVLSLLEKRTGQPLIVDRAALAEVGASYDSQVNCNIKRATLRSVLKKILADLNLAYIIKDESIQIVSIEKARNTLSTRSYYVGDLVGLSGGGFGPFSGRLQAGLQLQQLAVLITQTVEPESWLVNDKGGQGTIAFNPISFSFVVRQTAEIHFRMGLGGR